MDEPQALSDISSSHPVENHEQVIFQVIDSKGTSKFSELNLAPSLDWSDLLVSVLNMAANSHQHVVANAISCAIRSVNASSKCDPTDAFSLGEIRENSYFSANLQSHQKVFVQTYHPSHHLLWIEQMS